MTEKSTPKTRNRLFQVSNPTILFSAAMMTMSISILSPRYLVAAFTGLPIKTIPATTTHRGQASHPDLRQFTMGTIFSSPSLLPSQHFRSDNHNPLTRSLQSDKSSLSSTSSRRRHHLFHYCSSTATALNSIRGGSIDGATSDEDDGTTSSTQTHNASSPKNQNILPLPPSLRRRQDDIHAALRAVVAACRVTRSLQPEGTLFQNDNHHNLHDNIYNNNITTLSKQDASPVTIGDFASQAVALQILHAFFPQDVYLAEEGSEALRAEERLLEKVWEAVHGACDGSWVLGRRDRGGMEDVWEGREGLLEAIDFGRGSGGISNDGTAMKTRRVWALDPIDGTKGFLRGRLSGGQYCVALALIEDGVPMLSVLGCPNLPAKRNHDGGHDNVSNGNAHGKAPYGAWTEEEVQESEKATMKSTIGSKKQMFLENRGCLFLAVRGCGCYEIPLHLLERSFFDQDSWSDSESDFHGNDNRPWTRLYVTPNNSDETTTTNTTTNNNTNTKASPSQATFCLGIERSFSDPKGTILQIAKFLHGPDGVVTGDDGIPDIVNSLRMDGQVKYGLLARGEAQYFLRLPKEGYVDWIWDVAAGYGVLTEAGGRMTDVLGEEIDFSEIGVGGKAKLPESVRGIFGSCGGKVFHDALVDAYSEVEGGRR